MSKSAPAKQKRAIDLVIQHRRASTGVVSRQVLQEYFVTVTRKLRVDAKTARRKVQLLAEFAVATPELLTFSLPLICIAFTVFLSGTA